MRCRTASKGIIPLIVVLAAGAVTASASLSSQLALDVSRVHSGELWRLFSGHLAHLTWRHYVVDAFAYWVLFTTYAGKRGLSTANVLAITASVVVSVAVTLLRLNPIYGGLSGLCCGACAAIILAMVLDNPNDFMGYVLALLFISYLGLTEGLVAGIPVAHEAHWAGALTGITIECVRYYWTRMPAPKDKMNVVL